MKGAARVAASFVGCVGMVGLLAADGVARAEDYETWTFEQLRIESGVARPGGPLDLNFVLSGAPGASSRYDEPTYAATFHVHLTGLSTITDSATLEFRWNDLLSHRLKLQRIDGPGASSMVEWAILDIVNGGTKGFEISDELDLWLSNYPQVNSPRVGANHLAAVVGGDTPGSVSARVGSDSFIRRGVAPASVTVEDMGLQIAPSNVHITARINTVNELARWIEASVLVVDKGQRVVGEESIWLDVGTERTVHLSLRTHLTAPGNDVYLVVRHPAGRTPYLRLTSDNEPLLRQAWQSGSWTFSAIVGVTLVWIALSNWSPPKGPFLWPSVGAWGLWLCSSVTLAGATDEPPSLPRLPAPAKKDLMDVLRVIELSSVQAAPEEIARTNLWWTTRGGIAHELVLVLSLGVAAPRWQEFASGAGYRVWILNSDPA